MVRSVSSGGRRSPNPRRRAAAATLALALGLWMLGATPAALADSTPTPSPSPSSTPAAAAFPAGVSLTLAPDSAGVLTTGQDLGATVTVDNTSGTPVEAGSITLTLDQDALSTRDELTDWLHPADTSSGTSSGTSSSGTSSSGTSSGSSRPSYTDTVTAALATPLVAPGSSMVFHLGIPAASLDLSDYGAYGVRAVLTTGTTTWNAVSAVVWSVDAPTQPALLATVMPLTVDPSDVAATGLITADTLATLTAPGGTLSKKLEGVIGRPVTLAIDPLIIASIRVLGTAAPQSSLDWLASLAAAPNETFALAYADSDPSVQRSAGAPNVLGPGSFTFALESANFQTLPSPDPFDLPGQTGPVSTTAPTPPTTPTTAPTPSPTATPAAGTLPSDAELTQWEYTRTDIAWPRAGTASTSDLDFFAASGMPTAILSTDNLVLPDTSAIPSASSNVGDKNVILSDAEITDALQTATTAGSEAEREAALATVSATLAVITANADTGSTPTVVASLGRPAPTSAFGVSRALDSVEALPWAAETPLSGALTNAKVGVSIRDNPEPADWVATVGDMVGLERETSVFSTIIEQPELITGRQRLSLLAALAESWADDVDGRTAVVEAYDAATADTLSSVQIVNGSSINLVAQNANVPVLISNALGVPVTVTLQVTPSNGRLVVDPGTIDVTIPARSQKTAQVPVKAAVASGQVNLRLDLSTADGVVIASAAPKQINVSADWEGIGTLIVAIVAVLFLVFGVVRVVLRRRRARREPTEGAPDAAASAPTDDGVARG